MPRRLQGDDRARPARGRRPPPAADCSPRQRGRRPDGESGAPGRGAAPEAEAARPALETKGVQGMPQWEEETYFVHVMFGCRKCRAILAQAGLRTPVKGHLIQRAPAATKEPGR